jgi:hypothetical protein
MTPLQWTVQLESKRTEKAILLLPEHVRLRLFALIKDLSARGALQPSWHNYSKLGGDKHHCHLKKGKPTYVVCWRILDKKKKIIEVYYAGTHEKAPY